MVSKTPLSSLIASSVSSIQHADFILSPHPSTYPTCSLHISSLPSLPPLSEHKSLLSTHSLHLPLSLYQPSSLTDLTRTWPSFNSVIHRDFSSIGLQGKNPSECFIQTSKNHSFASIISVGPTLQSLFHSATPSFLRSLIKSRPLIGHSIRQSLISLLNQICATHPHHIYVLIGSDGSHRFQVDNKIEITHLKSSFSLSSDATCHSVSGIG